MSLNVLRPGERVALDRGSTAVVVPVAAQVELLGPCIASVVAHLPPDVPVLVAERTPRDPAVERILVELDRGRDGGLHYLQVEEELGPVALANKALEACSPADVVLLSSNAVVFAEWLESLVAAGRSDTTIATASALGNNAGPLSVAGEYEPLPGGADLERLAAEIAECSPRTRPRAPVADGHSVWIARAALELAGELDVAFGGLRTALTDFSQRCLVRGLVNVAADDVFVASLEPELTVRGDPLGAGDERALLKRRYPHVQAALDPAGWAELDRSRAAAARALRPASVTIDARILRGEFSGAQAETVELIETLDRSEGMSVRVLLDPAIGADARALLDRMPAVERLSAADLTPALERSDVVHRPYQVSSPEDLDLLARLGRRVVITHLDLIAFHNPGYFGSFESWRHHRRVTRQALAIADRVIFRSEHVVRDALREGLVERDRVRVMPMAVNREAPATAKRRPPGAPAEQSPFLLCIGNDFRHKNRLFAIRLLAALRERGWNGELVLAGAYVGHGSSRGDEAALLASRPELAARVRELPAVDEAEKAWLYANAAAVVYPTVHEGFGLIPFEAARAGTPCLFAPQASLAELWPAEAALLVPWDPEASAERALPVLEDGNDGEDGEARRRNVELLTAAAAQMDDWDTIGSSLLDLYEEAARLPLREAATLAVEAREREAELETWIALKDNLRDAVGPASPLPPDAQRGLIAVASRPGLSRPFFAALGALYRLVFRARGR